MRMNKHHALPGFTLVEISVTLILSALLLVALFRGFSQFQKTWYWYQNQQKNWTEWDHFRSQLTYDWESSQEVIPEANQGLACISLRKQVAYYWHEEYWVRKQGPIVDTFRITTDYPRYLLDNQKISQLTLPSRLSGYELPLILTKPYLHTESINQLLP